jgi:hypothetical protein
VAREADQILHSDTFRRAVDELREDLVKQIEDSPISDEGYRERLFLSLWVLRRVERQLQTLADEGKIRENNRKRSMRNTKGL